MQFAAFKSGLSDFFRNFLTQIHRSDDMSDDVVCSFSGPGELYR